MYTYYASTADAIDDQQKEERLVAFFTDVDIWEDGTPILMHLEPHGLKDDIVKFLFNQKLPEHLWDNETKTFRINPILWNKTYSYHVHDTEIVE